VQTARLAITSVSQWASSRTFEVKPIGRVESRLTDFASAPRQADKGAPEAWLFFEPEMLEGLRSLLPGDDDSLYGSCRFGAVPFDYQAKVEVGADDDGARPADGAMAALQVGECVTATACGSL
jgi:hypothetical protein